MHIGLAVPGLQLNLIDVHRACKGIAFAAFFKVFAVAPIKSWYIAQHGSGVGPQLRSESIRVGLQHDIASAARDGKLIQHTLA